MSKVIMGRLNASHSRTVVFAELCSSVSVMASTTPSQPQQINVTDLDLPQLADVRRQLEEVHQAYHPRLRMG